MGLSRVTLWAVVFLMLVGARAIAASPDVKKAEWNGHEMQQFSVDGRSALLVVPKQPAAGKPWIWRTEFFGVDPQADIALLGKGLHVAYIDVGGLFGAPKALDAMDKYYAHVRENYGLNPKPALEGFSRGGLYAFNWAARHPDQVSCLYVDAPVCDFKSWPGGKGRSRFAGREWRGLLAAYEMTDEQARAYKLNPVDNLAPLATAKIPILSVIGDMHDWIVPIEENTLLVEKRYQELGGEILVIKKPKAGHRPHSLPDPKPIVEFVLKHTASEPRSQGDAGEAAGLRRELSAASPGGGSTPVPATPPVPGTPPSASAEASPWIPLFNGKNLDGWRAKIKGYDLGDNFGDTFRVVDGLLTVSYDNYDRFNDRFGHLFYEKPFSRYVIRVEYRFIGDQVPGGPEWAFRNSGIMIHGQSPESIGKDQEFPASIEVQFLGGRATGERPTANLCTPGTDVVLGGKLLKQHCISSKSKTYHGDQWVTVEIEVRGAERIRHIVEGQVVLEYTAPQLDNGTPLKEGTISLQSESHPVQFRKVELRELKD